eukprot:CAMPEP_0170186224 /NCGR_PEP_ID=MMETSP0040_2-20121228/38543_1 /TAXON_ID=641309 /ORGANISM="Lotharella oceanica, Strain CCMP622" /LENGTH=129 /DNA_ID=CAMNT_0010432889 /DNA_START=394 /DNA_END=784 /DNA_ORIENTATION=+
MLAAAGTVGRLAEPEVNEYIDLADLFFHASINDAFAPSSDQTLTTQSLPHVATISPADDALGLRDPPEIFGAAPEILGRKSHPKPGPEWAEEERTLPDRISHRLSLPSPPVLATSGLYGDAAHELAKPV